MEDVGGKRRRRKMEGIQKKKVPGVPTNTRESVKDPRFAQVLRNPVYRPVPKKEKRVEIDRRFQGMFKDEKFKLKFKVDKRGRPMATATDEDMRRYYNLEGEEDDAKEEESTSDEEDDDVEGNVGEEEIGRRSKEKIDQKTRKKLHSTEVDYARGEGDLEVDSSDDASASSEDDSEDSEEETEVTMLEHDWGELDKDAERTEEGTRRLALCNMDWDRVRAVDLMVLLSSFLPPGGVVKSVAVYPSEFGKERMAAEDVEGPRELKGIKKEEGEEDSEDDTGGDESDSEGEGGGYHREKLREYQLKRLRYFYAVAEFDSVATAEKVYGECDGMEYESSAAKVDLRFIPEEMSFEGEEAREVCTEMPEGGKYRPRFFTTTALQQVKVDLTWDETDPLRRELTEKIFDPKGDVGDEEIRAYLATSSEEEEDDEEEDDKLEDKEEEAIVEGKGKKMDAISKYKALLEGIGEEEKKRKGREDGVEMEVTWGVGIRDKTEKLVKKKLEEEGKKGRTPWEEMLDKRKEKRMNRKKGKKGEEEEDDKPFSDDEVDVDMEDEFFKSELRDNEIFREGGGDGGKKKKVKKGGKDEVIGGKDKNAELELLLMEDDEEAGKRHFSLKKIMKEEEAGGDGTKKKKKWRKNKKKAMESADGGDAASKDTFEIDVGDQRFGALFSSHHFNVDPSDPNFKKTRAMERIIAEKQKRRLDKTSIPSKSTSKPDLEEGLSNKRRSTAELSYLVKKIKRNTETSTSKKRQPIKK